MVGVGRQNDRLSSHKVLRRRSQRDEMVVRMGCRRQLKRAETVIDEPVMIVGLDRQIDRLSSFKEG